MVWCREIRTCFLYGRTDFGNIYTEIITCPVKRGTLTGVNVGRFMERSTDQYTTLDFFTVKTIYEDECSHQHFHIRRKSRNRTVTCGWYTCILLTAAHFSIKLQRFLAWNYLINLSFNKLREVSCMKNQCERKQLNFYFDRILFYLVYLKSYISIEAKLSLHKIYLRVVFIKISCNLKLESIDLNGTNLSLPGSRVNIRPSILSCLACTPQSIQFYNT